MCKINNLQTIVLAENSYLKVYLNSTLLTFCGVRPKDELVHVHVSLDQVWYISYVVNSLIYWAMTHYVDRGYFNSQDLSNSVITMAFLVHILLMPHLHM